MKSGVVYNERSWAIDLIGHVKGVASSQNRAIKDAGGEQTIYTEAGCLFPDILLFGDKSLALILQGWELKMPDTRIDDPRFRDNAARKALALGLDSFVLWNVSQARLYIRQGKSEKYACVKSWDDLAHIQSRDAVTQSRAQWKRLATKIIAYLNDLFDQGDIEGRRFVETYKSGGVTSLIMENSGDMRSALKDAAGRDAKLKDQIILWWDRHGLEYGEKSDPYQALAQVNISNWIGKFLFAHILQGKDNRAQAINRIGATATPDHALVVFEQLSRDCNFRTIFSSGIGLSVVPERAWNQILQFNELLFELRVGEIDQSQLADILSATAEVAARKLRGQYPTPPLLARLLVELCVNNINEDRLLDPCCGSGAIPRVALEQKLQAGVRPDQAALTVFAGDQDPQAVQIATFALAKPDLIDAPLRLYCDDAFFLSPDKKLAFTHPRTGDAFTEKMGRFDVVASNLPFVAQNGRKGYEKAIESVNAFFAEGEERLPKRADIAAYLPFAFYPLLPSGGRLGVIITNAWLSTAWGDAFFDLISRYYNLRCVVTSGVGRWFQVSAVVTNILVMEKKSDPNEAEVPVNFVVLKRPLEELKDSMDLAVAQIRTGRAQNEMMSIRSVSRDRIRQFRAYGLGGSAQFVDCDWILDLPLAPVKDFFVVRRGERRGWDEMFYPAPGHGIEAEYIRPALKSSTEISRYTTTARSGAFSCSKSIEELLDAGHTGAVAWIRRFESGVNKVGKPLPEALARAGGHWHEMGADALSDLVMPLNFGFRLFVSRLNPPAYVNQRLIRFNARDRADLELCHALLNSAISLFIIEGMGFGRGQGVLDLSKDRIEKFMRMLNPDQLKKEQEDDIKAAFALLSERDLLEVADEVEQQDRQRFDETVIDAFGLSVSREEVYESLVNLVEIRWAAYIRSG